VSDTLETTLTETRGPLAVISLAGVLNHHTAPAFHEQAAEVAVTCPQLLVDLTGLTFCDSSGLNTLLRLHRRLGTLHGWLALAAPPAQLRRLLAVTGMSTVFRLYADLAEARTACITPTGP
jgi:anti-sigma B factor antagonist